MECLTLDGNFCFFAHRKITKLLEASVWIGYSNILLSKVAAVFDPLCFKD